MMWSSRITSIGFQFAVPVGFGWWLDRRWGTEPWLTVVGALLGFLTGTLALVQLAKDGKLSKDERRQIRRAIEEIEEMDE